MKNKTAVLVTLLLATAMAALDSSIVNVSLPVMQKEFGASINGIQWVITGYMISFCLFIPLTNWLKRRLGYYRLFISSVCVFTIGSLLCSLSTSLEMLVAARVFQAIGGGALSPVSLAILNDYFPKEEKGSAIGWWGMGNVVGPALGPTLGGLLTEYFGWPSIFIVNLPIGILTIYMSVKYLSFLKNDPVSKPAFDISGYIFFALFIMMLQYAITAAADMSMSFWVPLACVAGSIFFLQLFIKSSSRKQNPLIELSVFSRKAFNRSAFIVFIRSLALYGGLFFLPFLLQNLMGFSELQTGLLILPNALIMLCFRPYAGKLADKGIIKRPSIVGIICVALSMFQFGLLDADSSIVWVILGMLTRGFGMALLVSPVSTALLNAVTKEQTTTATSVNSLLQQTGGSLGIAISALLHSYILHTYINAGKTDIEAEHLALVYGFFISGLIVLLALIPAAKLPDNNIKEVDHQPLSAPIRGV